MFPLCVIVIVASLVLGGGTRSGFLSDAILQLIAIPLLLVALWKLLETPLTKQMRVALFFCLAAVAIPLIQLIPLPPWLWTALPGREPAVEVFELLGDKLSWMPISLSPNATWVAALALTPPIAIFLGTMLSTYRERRWLSLVFLAVGVVSVFLGFIQVAQGQKSPWRFFAFTNIDDAVGFFANRNHFAVLLYALIMFAAAWLVHTAAGVGQQRQGRRYDTASFVPTIGAFTLLVVLLAGEAIARSRLGLGFTIAALLGAVALAVSDRRIGSAVTATRLIVGAVALVLIFSTQFALYRILGRFAQDPLQTGRIPFSSTTVEAARALMPLGSGLGTSVPVYAMFEKPERALLDKIVNHHNDVLELWLTTGAVGFVLTGMFVVWLLLRSVEIWRKGLIGGASEIDWTLARGATIVAALMVAQSFIDSPLRTGATMAVLAFACALLIEPPLNAKTVQQTSALEAKKTRLPQIPRLAPAAAPAEQRSALIAKIMGLPRMPRLAPAATLAA